MARIIPAAGHWQEQQWGKTAAPGQWQPRLGYASRDGYTWFQHPVATPARWAAWGQVDQALNAYLHGQHHQPGAIKPVWPRAAVPEQTRPTPTTQQWEDASVEAAKKSAEEAARHAQVARGAATRLTEHSVGDLVDSVGALAETVKRMEDRAALVEERDQARLKAVELQARLAELASRTHPLTTDAAAVSGGAELAEDAKKEAPVMKTEAAVEREKSEDEAVASMRLAQQRQAAALMEQSAAMAEQQTRHAELMHERQNLLAERQLLAEKQMLEDAKRRAADVQSTPTDSELVVRDSRADPTAATPTRAKAADASTHPELVETRVELARLAGAYDQLKERLADRRYGRRRSSRSSESSADESSSRRRSSRRLPDEASEPPVLQARAQRAEAEVDELRRQLQAQQELRYRDLEAALARAQAELAARKDADSNERVSSNQKRENLVVHAAGSQPSLSAEQVAAEVSSRVAAEVQRLRAETTQTLERQRADAERKAALERAKVDADRAADEDRWRALLEDQRRQHRELLDMTTKAAARQRKEEEAAMQKDVASDEAVPPLQAAAPPPTFAQARPQTFVAAPQQQQQAVQQHGDMPEATAPASSSSAEVLESKIVGKLRELLTEQRQAMSDEQKALREEVSKALEERADREKENAEPKLAAAASEDDRSSLVDVSEEQPNPRPKSASKLSLPPRSASPQRRRESSLQGEEVDWRQISTPKSPAEHPVLGTPRWTKSFRSLRAVKVTFGDSDVATEAELRRHLKQFGPIAKVGRRQTAAVVLFADATAAAKAVRAYQGPWRLERVVDALSPWGANTPHFNSPAQKQHPFSLVETSSRGFEQRAVEVIWGGHGLAPASDDEFKNHFAFFGSIVRAFRHKDRGMIMFADADECDSCLSDYRGPWRVTRLAAGDDDKKFGSLSPRKGENKNTETANDDEPKPDAVAHVAARTVRCVFPGGDDAVPEAEIQRAMGRFGTVIRVKLGQAQAVVLFATSDEADRAVDEYRGPWLLDRASGLAALRRTSSTGAPPETSEGQQQEPVTTETIRAAAVKVAWSAAAPPPSDLQLRQVLGAFGRVQRVAVRRRSALALFHSEADAQAAVDGYDGPWRLRRLFQPLDDGPASPRLIAPTLGARLDDASDPSRPRGRDDENAAPDRADPRPGDDRGPTLVAPMEEDEATSLIDDHDDRLMNASPPSVAGVDDGAALRDDAGPSGVAAEPEASAEPRSEPAEALAATFESDVAADEEPPLASREPSFRLPEQEETTRVSDAEADAALSPEADHPGTTSRAAASDATAQPGTQEETLASRCVKVSWKKKPPNEDAFRAALAGMDVAYVMAKLRDKSAVVLFATSEDALDAVARINAHKDWTAVPTEPLVARLGPGQTARARDPASELDEAPGTTAADNDARLVPEQPDAASPRQDAVPLSERCIKVTWPKQLRPRDDATFSATLASMGLVPVSAKLRTNSAVVMFPDADAARGAVDVIRRYRDSNDVVQVGRDYKSVRWSGVVVADTLQPGAPDKSLSPPAAGGLGFSPGARRPSHE